MAKGDIGFRIRLWLLKLTVKLMKPSVEDMKRATKKLEDEGKI